MNYFLRNYRMNAKIHDFSIRLHVLDQTLQVQFQVSHSWLYTLGGFGCMRKYSHISSEEIPLIFCVRTTPCANLLQCAKCEMWYMENLRKQVYTLLRSRIIMLYDMWNCVPHIKSHIFSKKFRWSFAWGSLHERIFCNARNVKWTFFVSQFWQTSTLNKGQKRIFLFFCSFWHNRGLVTYDRVQHQIKTDPTEKLTEETEQFIRKK